MKNFKLNVLLLFLFELLSLGCNQADAEVTSGTAEKTTVSTDGKEPIQNLIRQVLNWSQSKTPINLLPVLTNNKGYCISIDFKKHRLNLERLKATNLFAAEFIENLNQIILALDKKIRNKAFEKWDTHELPPFNFSSDVDPWCSCQDVPYDKPNPWDYIKINVINLDNKKGTADWKWGKIESNTDPSWKDFAYRFRVAKENDKWKISYLEGFDFKRSTSSARL